MSKYPLAFLPENFDQKVQLLKKGMCFAKGFANGMKCYDTYIVNYIIKLETNNTRNFRYGYVPYNVYYLQ